jgi:hypothetical protein
VKPASSREVVAINAGQALGKSGDEVLDQIRQFEEVMGPEPEPQPEPEPKPERPQTREDRRGMQLTLRKLQRRFRRHQYRQEISEGSTAQLEFRVGKGPRPATPAVRSRTGYLRDLVWADDKGRYEAHGAELRRTPEQRAREADSTLRMATVEPLRRRQRYVMGLKPVTSHVAAARPTCNVPAERLEAPRWPGRQRAALPRSSEWSA